MIRVQNIEQEQVARGRYAYWITMEKCSRKLRIEIDETQKVRLYHWGDAEAVVGRPAVSLITRLVIRYHDGENIALPQDIEVG
jgi:hypothetical protein